VFRSPWVLLERNQMFCKQTVIIVALVECLFILYDFLFAASNHVLPFRSSFTSHNHNRWRRGKFGQNWNYSGVVFDNLSWISKWRSFLKTRSFRLEKRWLSQNLVQSVQVFQFLLEILELNPRYLSKKYSGSFSCPLNCFTSYRYVNSHRKFLWIVLLCFCNKCCLNQQTAK